MKIEVPKNTRQLRSFLGTAGWYCRFIQNFSGVSAPLTDCLKNKTKFTWTEEATTPFETLKKALWETLLDTV